MVYSVIKIWILSLSNTMSDAMHFAPHVDDIFSMLKVTKHPVLTHFLENINGLYLHYL